MGVIYGIAQGYLLVVQNITRLLISEISPPPPPPAPVMTSQLISDNPTIYIHSNALEAVQVCSLVMGEVDNSSAA